MSQIILRQEDRDTIITLDKDVTSIGRGPDNQIVIRSDKVSRRHCEIRKTGDDFSVVDLDSRNGIFINGERVKEHKLNLGDEVAVGDALVIYERELPKTESSTATASSATTNAGSAGRLLGPDEFINPTYQSHSTIVLLGTLILIGTVIIAFWYGRHIGGRNRLPKNLISRNSSFESPSGASAVAGWFLPEQSAAQISVVTQEKHEGAKSLLVEKGQAAKEFYTECGYETLLRVHRFAETGSTAVKSFNFGGWVKSDPLQRSFAGYKMAWFKEGDDVPLAEACTALVYSPTEWKRLETVSAAPAQADYGRFYCISVGVAGRTYFDDIYVTSSSSGRGPGDYEVGDRSLRLAVSSRGLWRLHHNDQPILLEGEFVMNSAGVISKQSATIPENGIAAGVQQYQPGRHLRFTIPMLHPQTINWLDAGAEGRQISEPPSVQMFYSISKSVMAEESYSIIFRLLPGQIKGSLRFVAGPQGHPAGGSQTKERSHLEEIAESDISETAIELSDCLLSIKYSDAVNLRVIRNGVWLEFIQTFTPPRTGDTAVVGMEFFVKPLLSESASALQETIAKAEELSKRDLLGQALQLYRDVLEQVDRKSAIAQRVQTQLTTLEDKAHRLIADASELVEVAGLLGDKTLYQQAGTLCQQVIKLYKNTEFDIQAHKILQQSEAGLKNIDTDSVEVNAEKVLTIADGYSKSGNNNLARWLYERVLERYPASATAQEAKAKLKDIK